MKYLKTWTGVTSGSYAGRDDGYPVEKSRTFTDLDELARSFGSEKNEKYFKVQEISVADLKNEIAESLKKQKEMTLLRKKVEIEDKIYALQEELRKLK